MALDDTDRTIAARAHEVGWTKVGADLHAQGRAIAPGLSTAAEAGVTAGRYGVHVFPLQIAILLDQPGEDFEGGAFVITEKRARMQTRALVLPLEDGDAAIVAVNSRPMAGVRGDCQVRIDDGVGKLRSGRRHTLGVILPDPA